MTLKKRLASFRFAFKGIRVLFASQPNARIHLIAALLAVLAGWYTGISHLEWLILTGWITLVICLEAVNTALEFLTDLVSPQHHPLAGKVKDVAAAAVLLAAAGAVISGGLIFLPKLFWFG
jgi:diacylglycerol kinase